MPPPGLNHWGSSQRPPGMMDEEQQILWNPDLNNEVQENQWTPGLKVTMQDDSVAPMKKLKNQEVKTTEQAVPEYHLEENDQETNLAEEETQEVVKEVFAVSTSGPVLVTPGVTSLFKLPEINS